MSSRTTELRFESPGAQEVTALLDRLASAEDEVARATRDLGTEAGTAQAEMDRLAKEAGEHIPRAMERMRVATAREREEAARMAVAMRQGGNAVQELRVQLAGEAAERRALARVRGEANAAQREEAAAIRANVEATERNRQALRSLEQQKDRTTRSSDRMTRSLGGMHRQLLAVGAAMGVVFSTREIVAMAGAWTDLESRITNAIGSAERMPATMARVYEMAQRSYTGIEETTDAWLRNAEVLDALGIQLERQLDLTEVVNNSLLINATRGMRAEHAMRGWNDAMADGELRIQRFNMIMRYSPRLISALADSLGVSVLELRNMAAAGEIGREELLGVTSQLEKLRAEADAMPATMQDAGVQFRNATMLFVGNLDRVTGASSAMASVVQTLAASMEQWASHLNPEDVQLYTRALEHQRAELEKQLDLLERWAGRRGADLGPGEILGKLFAQTELGLRDLFGGGRDTLDDVNERLAALAGYQEEISGHSLAGLQAEYAGLQMQIQQAQAAAESGSRAERRAAEDHLSDLRRRVTLVQGAIDAERAAQEGVARTIEALAESYDSLAERQQRDLDTAQRRLAATRQGVEATRALDVALVREAATRAALAALHEDEKANADALAVRLGVQIGDRDALAAAIQREASALGAQAAAAEIASQARTAHAEMTREAEKAERDFLAVLEAVEKQIKGDNANRQALREALALEQRRLDATRGGAEALRWFNEEQAVAAELAKYSAAYVAEFGDEIEALARALFRAGEAAAEFAQASKTAADIAAEAWKNAGEDFQRTVVNVIDDALSGSIDSFQDWAGSIWTIYRRLAAQLIAAPLVMPIQQAFAGIYGGAGAAGVGGAPAAAQLGYLGGAAGAAAGGGFAALNPFGFVSPVGMERQFIDFAISRGMGPGAGSALGYLGYGLGLAGTGLFGAGLGGMAAGLIGYNNTESKVGGGLGGIAGTLIGGPVGALIGSALGGIIGGLFGGKDYPFAETSIAFRDGQFVQTGTRSKDKGPAEEIGKAGGQIVDALNKVLPALQQAGVDISRAEGLLTSFGYSSKASSVTGKGYFGGVGATTVRNEGDAQAAAEAVVFDMLRRVVEASPPEGLASHVIARIFNNADIDAAIADLDFAVQFKNTVEALKNASLDFAQTVRGEVITALNAQFDQLHEWTDTARRLGLASAESDAAARAFVETLAGIRDAGAASTQTEIELAALEARFETLAKRAPEFGVGLDAIAAAMEKARQQLRSEFFAGLDAAINVATGREFLNTLTALKDQMAAAAREAAALDAAFGGFEAGARVIELAAAQFRQFIATLDPAEIEAVLASWSNIPAHLAGIAQDALAAATGQALEAQLAAATGSLEAATATFVAANAAAARAQSELANIQQEIADRTARSVIALYEDNARAAEEIARAAASTLSEADRAASAARSDLAAALDREAAALEATRDSFMDLADALRAFRRDLSSQARGLLPGPRGYEVERARFRTVATAAAGGDIAAMEQLREAGQAFLDASLRRSVTREDYLRDLALVQQAVIDAEAAAGEQVDISEEQLAALREQVGQLIDLNENMLSVADAIAALIGAQEVQTEAANDNAARQEQAEAARAIAADAQLAFDKEQDARRTAEAVRALAVAKDNILATYAARDAALAGLVQASADQSAARALLAAALGVNAEGNAAIKAADAAAAAAAKGLLDFQRQEDANRRTEAQTAVAMAQQQLQAAWSAHNQLVAAGVTDEAQLAAARAAVDAAWSNYAAAVDAANREAAGTATVISQGWQMDANRRAENQNTLNYLASLLKTSANERDIVAASRSENLSIAQHTYNRLDTLITLNQQQLAAASSLASQRATNDNSNTNRIIAAINAGASGGVTGAAALMAGDPQAAARFLTANTDVLNAYYSLTAAQKKHIRDLGYDPSTATGYAIFHYATMGRNEGRRLFAKGAAFLRPGVYQDPTDFDLGTMAEAGPEAVMPLARTPGGGLGVRAAADPATHAMLEELRASRRQTAEMIGLLIAIADRTDLTAAELNSIRKLGLYARGRQPGDAVETAAAA